MSQRNSMPNARSRRVRHSPHGFDGDLPRRCRGQPLVCLRKIRRDSAATATKYPFPEDITMKLYYSPGACSLSDHIVLEWIGAPYEAVRVSREQRQTPEFRKLNPAGAVPVFEQDGWVLTQNAAILNYLAD